MISLYFGPNFAILPCILPCYPPRRPATAAISAGCHREYRVRITDSAARGMTAARSSPDCPDHPASRITELLPWNWKAARLAIAA